MNTYEIVIILDPRKIEDNGDSFAQIFTTDVEKIGGKVIDTVNMGRRNFARAIGKSKAGVYLNFIVELNAQDVDAHTHTYHLNEAVLRHMAFTHDEAAAKYRAKGTKAAAIAQSVAQDL